MNYTNRAKRELKNNDTMNLKIKKQEQEEQEKQKKLYL